MLNKYLDPRHTLTNWIGWSGWTGWTDWTGWLTGLTGLDRLDRLDRLDWLDWRDWQGWCGHNVNHNVVSALCEGSEMCLKKSLFFTKKSYFFLQKKVTFFYKKKLLFFAKKSTSRTLREMVDVEMSAQDGHPVRCSYMPFNAYGEKYFFL